MIFWRPKIPTDLLLFPKAIMNSVFMKDNDSDFLNEGFFDLQLINDYIILKCIAWFPWYIFVQGQRFKETSTFPMLFQYHHPNNIQGIAKRVISKFNLRKWSIFIACRLARSTCCPWTFEPSRQDGRRKPPGPDFICIHVRGLRDFLGTARGAFSWF